MLEGLRAPPIEIVETDKASLILTDGHRRLIAARQCGQQLLAWVSPTVNCGTGLLNTAGHSIKTSLTFEMWSARGAAACEGSAFLETTFAQSLESDCGPEMAGV